MVTEPTDYRALCAELADELATSWPSTFDQPDCLIRAYAALDEPEPEAEWPTYNELYDFFNQHTSEYMKMYANEAPKFMRAVLARWGNHFPGVRKMVSPTTEGEVAGPTDEELLALVPQGSESDFYLPQGLPSDWVDGDFIAPPGAVLAFARAVLARYGHQPAPPAKGDCPACEGVPKPGNQPCAVCGRSAPPVEGEVAELVAELRMMASQAAEACQFTDAESLSSAADLLEQLND